MHPLYDDVQFDVNKLLIEQCKSYNCNSSSSKDFSFFDYLKSIFNFFYYGFLLKTGLLRKFIYSNIFLGWFYEFKKYWENALGFSPMELHDFYYLSCVYRSRAHILNIPENPSPNEQLEVWQKPHTIYLLFQWCYRYAFQPLMYNYIKWVKKGNNILEYGSGIAPIATALIRFKRHLNIKITCADIPSIWLHFVKWKFKEFDFVRIVTLDSKIENSIPDNYDIIICREVLEHLPNPFEVVRYFYERLTGGVFLYLIMKKRRERVSTLKLLLKNVSEFYILSAVIFI